MGGEDNSSISSVGNRSTRIETVQFEERSKHQKSRVTSSHLSFSSSSYATKMPAAGSSWGTLSQPTQKLNEHSDTSSHERNNVSITNTAENLPNRVMAVSMKNSLENKVRRVAYGSPNVDAPKKQSQTGSALRCEIRKSKEVVTSKPHSWNPPSSKLAFRFVPPEPVSTQMSIQSPKARSSPRSSSSPCESASHQTNAMEDFDGSEERDEVASSPSPYIESNKRKSWQQREPGERTGKNSSQHHDHETSCDASNSNHQQYSFYTKGFQRDGRFVVSRSPAGSTDNPSSTRRQQHSNSISVSGSNDKKNNWKSAPRVKNFRKTIGSSDAQRAISSTNKYGLHPNPYLPKYSACSNKSILSQGSMYKNLLKPVQKETEVIKKPHEKEAYGAIIETPQKSSVSSLHALFDSQNAVPILPMNGTNPCVRHTGLPLAVKGKGQKSISTENASASPPPSPSMGRHNLTAQLGGCGATVPSPSIKTVGLASRNPSVVGRSNGQPAVEERTKPVKVDSANNENSTVSKCGPTQQKSPKVHQYYKAALRVQNNAFLCGKNERNISEDISIVAPRNDESSILSADSEVDSPTRPVLSSLSQKYQDDKKLQQQQQQQQQQQKQRQEVQESSDDPIPITERNTIVNKEEQENISEGFRGLNAVPKEGEKDRLRRFCMSPSWQMEYKWQGQLNRVEPRQEQKSTTTSHFDKNLVVDQSSRIVPSLQCRSESRTESPTVSIGVRLNTIEVNTPQRVPSKVSTPSMVSTNQNNQKPVKEKQEGLNSTNTNDTEKNGSQDIAKDSPEDSESVFNVQNLLPFSEEHSNATPKLDSLAYTSVLQNIKESNNKIPVSVVNRSWQDDSIRSVVQLWQVRLAGGKGDYNSNGNKSEHLKTSNAVQSSGRYSSSENEMENLTTLKTKEFFFQDQFKANGNESAVRNLEPISNAFSDPFIEEKKSSDLSIDEDRILGEDVMHMLSSEKVGVESSDCDEKYNLPLKKVFSYEDDSYISRSDTDPIGSSASESVKTASAQWQTIETRNSDDISVYVEDERIISTKEEKIFSAQCEDVNQEVVKERNKVKVTIDRPAVIYSPAVPTLPRINPSPKDNDRYRIGYFGDDAPGRIRVAQRRKHSNVVPNSNTKKSTDHDFDIWASTIASNVEHNEVIKFDQIDHWMDNNPDIGNNPQDEDLASSSDLIKATSKNETPQKTNAIAAHTESNASDNYRILDGGEDLKKSFHIPEKQRVFDPFGIDCEDALKAENPNDLFSANPDPFITDDSFSPLEWPTPSGSNNIFPNGHHTDFHNLPDSHIEM